MGLAGRCLIHLYTGLLADLQDAHLPLFKTPQQRVSDDILAGYDFITHPLMSSPYLLLLFLRGTKDISYSNLFWPMCVP